MPDNTEVVFRMSVNHKAVKRAMRELENKVEASTVRNGLLTLYGALLCSDLVYVPEAQLERFLPFCKKTHCINNGETK